MAMEMSRMWNMKTKTIPLITGVIKKGENKYLEKILGSSVIGLMQKIPSVGSSAYFAKSAFQ